MKKKIVIACLIAAMAMTSLAGCGENEEVEVVSVDDSDATKDSDKADDEQQDNKQSEEVSEKQDSDGQKTDNNAEDQNGDNQKTSEDKVPEEVLAKCMTAYKQVLDNWCTAVDSNFIKYSEGTFGLQEAAMGYSDPADIIGKAGYFLYDINKDGIPELMMASIDEDDYKTESVIAMYAFDGDKTANLLFEGWARNRYAIANDGTIYNTGSGGAAYSIFASYTLEKNESELTLHDYFFTEPIDEETIGVFHNTTGSSDRAESEDVTNEKTFDDLWSLCEERTRYFEVEYLKEYKETREIKDREQTIVVVKEAYDSIDETEADVYKNSDDYANKLVVLASEDVKNLKVMKISLKDVTEEGKVIYDVDELYTQKELKIDRPLLLGVTFWGDLPEYGISYEDQQGRTFQYAIYQSGRDGSMVMEEF